jgi:signal peptidase I
VTRDKLIVSLWIGLALVAGLAFFGARAFLYEPFRIPSSAMAPSIERGAFVVVAKHGYGNYRLYGMRLGRAPLTAEVRRGDVLVFEYPGDPSLDYIKRVAGLPGDRISYLGKRLRINGRDIPTEQIEDYASKDGLIFGQYKEALGEEPHSIIVEPEPQPPLVARAFPHHERCTYPTGGVICQVPDGHYFMLGDNRDNSADSRVWGFVPAQNLVGKVAYVLQ